MKRKTKSSLEIALQRINLKEELMNYRTYEALRKAIIQKYKISYQYMEYSKDYQTVIARMILYSLIKKHTSYTIRDICLLFQIRNPNKVFHPIAQMRIYIQKNINRRILKEYGEIEVLYQQFLRN